MKKLVTLFFAAALVTAASASLAIITGTTPVTIIATNHLHIQIMINTVTRINIRTMIVITRIHNGMIVMTMIATTWNVNEWHVNVTNTR